MGQVVVLEDVMALIKQLPAGDKERLIAWIAPEIERESPQERSRPHTRTHLARSEYRMLRQFGEDLLAYPLYPRGHASRLNESVGVYSVDPADSLSYLPFR